MGKLGMLKNSMAGDRESILVSCGTAAEFGDRLSQARASGEGSERRAVLFGVKKQLNMRRKKGWLAT